MLYHVVNRGSRKGGLFDSNDDYREFERLISDARQLLTVRIVAYCLMPNHWHLLLWPSEDGELSTFMKWLTGTHALRWRRGRGTTGQGAVYQARFRATAVDDVWHLLAVWRYIERNPLAAGLVSRAEDWPWSSAAPFVGQRRQLPLDATPFALPAGWLDLVNSDTVPFLTIRDRKE